MGYLPGSHKLGIRKFVNIFIGPTEDPLSMDGLKDLDPVFVEVPPGAVAFHHGLTFHLALPNATDRTRRVHTAIYFGDGSVRGSGQPHPSVDRAHIGVGEAIDSDVTPIAWPRSLGDVPLPPPDHIR